MKKITVILLIGIFAFSQYERQIIYIKCSLDNALNGSSLQCDCKKMTGLDSFNTTESPFPKTHFHPDDLFTLLKLHKTEVLPSAVFMLLNPGNNAQKQDGFYPENYHPPQA